MSHLIYHEFYLFTNILYILDTRRFGRIWECSQTCY